MPYEIEMPHWPPANWAHLNNEDTIARMLLLLDDLGNPQNHLPPVVHVAGTNGKGSTIAFMRAMLEAAGYSVHVYSSPHIRKFSERIVIAGKPVDEKALHTALEACRSANEERPITFFEGTTAAAFMLFSQVKADILLMETGMGGSLDATNVLDAVRLSIITPISEDHMHHLGDSLEEIASHKAGIIKNECPLVIGFQAPHITEFLEKEAKARNAPALVYGKHWAVQKAAQGFVYADGHGQITLPNPALKGPHQYLNAGCAIAALSLLDEFEIMGDHIAAGLKWVQWVGRLERIEPTNAVDDEWELWFDGGHNMAAGHVLAVIAEDEWSDKPLFIIFGTTRGKNVVGMLHPLAALAQEIIAVPVAAEPNCYSPQEIINQTDDAGLNLMQADSVDEAISTIKDISGDVPARILVFGSLYLHLEVIST